MFWKMSAPTGQDNSDNREGRCRITSRRFASIFTHSSVLLRREVRFRSDRALWVWQGSRLLL
ncbi:unnamed protein product [Toxocara canis]|uniref:Uncharacterized protein n=1 Tax=Toxocara canis TaxID=6265 RepID=A0A183U6N6_TOXCA|nr:unnamed protein product [Toxocara canis]